MTLEERLQQIIGQQAFAIAALQTELEKLQAELAKLQGTVKPSLRSVETSP
jgi:hypothetical protein